jgi:hypothetical protein
VEKGIELKTRTRCGEQHYEKTLCVFRPRIVQPSVLQAGLNEFFFAQFGQVIHTRAFTVARILLV